MTPEQWRLQQGLHPFTCVRLIDDPGAPITITPEGLRMLAQAKRWRRDRARKALYAASFMVAFALGTAAGLVLH